MAYNIAQETDTHYVLQDPMGGMTQIAKTPETTAALGQFMGSQDNAMQSQPLPIDNMAMPPSPDAMSQGPLPVPDMAPAVMQPQPGMQRPPMGPPENQLMQPPQPRPSPFAAQVANMSRNGGGMPLDVTGTFSPGVTVSNKTKQELMDADNKMLAANKQAATAEAEKADAIASEMMSFQQAQERVNAENQKKREKFDQALNIENDRLRAAQEEVKATKYDADRFFKEKSTGAKIGMAIAAALGAAGSALTGTKNFAMDMINDAVNRDIDSQKEEIAKKKDGVNMQSNLIAKLESQGMNRMQAENAAWITQAEIAKNKMQAVAAKSGSKEVMAKYEQSAANLDQQIAQRKAQYDMASQSRASYTVTANAPRGQSIDPGLAFQMDKDLRGRKVNMPDGQIYLADTEKLAEKAQTVNASADNMGRTLNELAGVLEMKGEKWRAKADALKADLVSDYAVLKKLGVLSGPDQELADKQFIDPRSWTNSDSKIIKSIQDYRDRVEQRRLIELKNYNLVPVR